jgi:hypothetical protein
VPQYVEDALLATLFIKSALTQCQVICSKPFVLQQILHKEDGYMITYSYEGTLVVG